MLLGLVSLSGILAAAQGPVVNDGMLRESDLATRERLQQALDAIASDPEKYKDALYFGEIRAKLCQACHGKDGNSVKQGFPSIAGQNPVYLVDQFNRYADGRRIDRWMASLSVNFSEEDKVRLAIFFSEQQAKPAGGGNPALLEQGRKLYNTHCSECHGADAKGAEGYAKLAGQRPEYTIKMLKEFQTASGKRYNPWMFARARLLRNDREIEAVASYLAQLP